MIIEIPEKINYCVFAGHQHTVKEESYLLIDMIANYIIEHQKLWYHPGMQNQATANLTLKRNCRWYNC